MTDPTTHHDIQQPDGDVPRPSRRDAVGTRSPPADVDSLQAENARLRDEAARALANMERARATAARALATTELANRAKSQFLSTMSHEIRTPINAVLGYVDLLETGTSGELNDQQRRHLARVRACATQLTDIVTTMFDLAWVGSADVEVAHMDADIGDLAETAIALAMPEAQRHGIALARDRSSDELRYIGDPARVRQILVNLLANAIKFTPNGGRITVSTSTRPADAEDAPSAETAWTTITIRDSGIGIANSQVDAVFEPFVQVDMSHTRIHGGSGLGLTISRRYARLMGGDITLASVHGAGSAFTLWLPAGTPAHTADAPPALPAPPPVRPLPDAIVPGLAHRRANPGTYPRKDRPRDD
jgi:signal transduction histidine kinase